MKILTFALVFLLVACSDLPIPPRPGTRSYDIQICRGGNLNLFLILLMQLCNVRPSVMPVWILIRIVFGVCLKNVNQNGSRVNNEKTNNRNHGGGACWVLQHESSR